MTERHYFITSLENDPKRILKFKRKHWGIENGLHWQLDVTFNEDDDRKRKNSAQNYSLIAKITLNILKNHQHKDKKASIKRKRMKAAWDEDYLKSLLMTWLKAF
ncbi:MAG: ISAs1 family transposase [Lachnospiraceae bacterium]|nr:ISAs1 family transposase [Lachnospiraceae bacterium]